MIPPLKILYLHWLRSFFGLKIRFQRLPLLICSQWLRPLHSIPWQFFYSPTRKKLMHARTESVFLWAGRCSHGIFKLTWHRINMECGSENVNDDNHSARVKSVFQIKTQIMFYCSHYRRRRHRTSKVGKNLEKIQQYMMFPDNTHVSTVYRCR